MSNALEVQPQGEITYAEFYETIRILMSSCDTCLTERGNREDVAGTSRIPEFLGLNTPSFIGLSVTKDKISLLKYNRKFLAYCVLFMLRGWN